MELNIICKYELLKGTPFGYFYYNMQNKNVGNFIEKEPEKDFLHTTFEYIKAYFNKSNNISFNDETIEELFDIANKRKYSEVIFNDKYKNLQFNLSIVPPVPIFEKFNGGIFCIKGQYNFYCTLNGKKYLHEIIDIDKFKNNNYFCIRINNRNSMKKYFENFDLTAFWDEDEEMPNKLTDKMVEKAEKSLGYRLPQSYIELLKTRNGGYPVNTCFPTKTPTSWADDHIAIESICGIGVEDGIDSLSGNRYMIEEWGYPEIGIMICNCPSAGHDAVFLDYSKCDKEDEPSVVHIDVEIYDKPTITFLAKNFETFVRGLTNEDKFDA